MAIGAAVYERLGPGFAGHAARVQASYVGESAALALPGLALPIAAPDLVTVLPWAFTDVAPTSDVVRDAVAVAGLLYRDYLLAFDGALDGHGTPDPGVLMAAGLWRERAVRLLQPHVPPDSAAWDELLRLGRQQVAAAHDERALAGAAGDFPTYAAVAAGRAAVLAAVPAMCCAAAGRESLVAGWDDVLAPFNVGVQLLDDLGDWRDDLAAGRASHVLARTLASAGLDAATPADADVLGHHLFMGGVADELLADAEDACEESAAAAQARGAVGWLAVTGLIRARCASLAEAVAQQRARLRPLAHRAPLRGEALAGADRVVAALARAHATGYAEANHRMQVVPRPPAEFQRPGGAPPDDRYDGDVFARGIVGWCYAQCEAAGCAVPPHVVEQNLDVLAARQVPGEGSWNYWPELGSLPPDLDDVAQVLHAFLARPGRDLEALFGRAVAVALHPRHRHPDGGIETFLVDPALSTAWQAWYERTIAAWWGRGAEAEVVANFAAALLAWRPDACADVVCDAARFVAAAQRADGAWESTWYVGPYYGTFAAARLLRAVAPALPDAETALGRARDFLLAARRNGEGWGTGARSDALSTALAVLALDAAAPDASPEVAAAVRDGVRYLLATQRADGVWAPTDFICMNIHRTQPALGERWAFYRSATVTGAFGAAALVAGARHCAA